MPRLGLLVLPPAAAACRMLEVTGGSMSTIYDAADLDFPAVYAVGELGREWLLLWAWASTAGHSLHCCLVGRRC